ncbi:diguanylate cyclase, partial [Candidatus Saccharibacteria bacterium]|nr:diguanylate cyclase [Candidatus Saccharibacteria bacterium]
MIMDLDNFKNINDCMGHMVGDDVLREFTSLLKRKLRKGETVARYGGEEFAVILPHVKGSDALKAAEAVRKTVESAEFSCSYEGITVTV